MKHLPLLFFILFLLFVYNFINPTFKKEFVSKSDQNFTLIDYHNLKITLKDSNGNNKKYFIGRNCKKAIIDGKIISFPLSTFKVIKLGTDEISYEKLIERKFLDKKFCSNHWKI